MEKNNLKGMIIAINNDTGEISYHTDVEDSALRFRMLLQTLEREYNSKEDSCPNQTKN